MRRLPHPPASPSPRRSLTEGRGRPASRCCATACCISRGSLLVWSLLALATTVLAIACDARWWRRSWWEQQHRHDLAAPLRSAQPAAYRTPPPPPPPRLQAQAQARTHTHAQPQPLATAVATAPSGGSVAPASTSPAALEQSYARLLKTAFHGWYKSFGNVPMDFSPHTPFFGLFAPIDPRACGGALTRIGGDGDGGKFVCVDATLRATTPPRELIVYSLGSNNQFRFEREIVLICPRCHVHMFDCFATGYQPAGKQKLATDKFSRAFGDLTPAQRARVHFHTLCIGPTPRKADPALWRSYSGIMSELKHTSVDMLKIDIEGGEFAVFKDLGLASPRDAKIALAKGVLPRQILLEAHLWSRRDEKRDHKWYDFVRSAYAAGYLPASREDNPACTFCSEFTLIRGSGSGSVSGGAAALAAAAAAPRALTPLAPPGPPVRTLAGAALAARAATGGVPLSDTAWMARPAWVASHIALQEEFRRAPAKAPRAPLVYRPKLHGMGWGNLLHDIAHHVILAAMLKRPFLMSLDVKDPHGVIETLLAPGRIDWRMSGEGSLGGMQFSNAKTLLRTLSGSVDSTAHVQLSCRPTHTKWHDLCGGNSHDGTLDRPLTELDAMPHTVIYSEFSGSIILPLRNSKRFRRWVKENLGTLALDAGGRTGGRGTIALAVRAAFWHLFTPAPRLTELLTPWRAKLGPQYVALHVRSGNMEDGSVGTHPHGDWVARIEACRAASSASHRTVPWLLLTDDVPLAHAAASSNVLVSTVEAGDGFNMANGMHVGKMHLSLHFSAMKKREVAVMSWERCIRDWMLIAEAPGAVLLRNTMASAGTYGRRAAFAAGKVCVGRSLGVKTGGLRSATQLLSCGEAFFKEQCGE